MAARAGGKFRPRAKPVLRQGTSGEVHSSHSNVVTEEPFTSVPNISDKMQFVRSLGTGDTCGDPHSSFGRSTGEVKQSYITLILLILYLTF